MAPRCRSSNKASRRRSPTATRSSSRVSAATSRRGTYTMRQDLAQLPAEPAGGHWEFTGVECDGATATVDAPTATATITLDAGAAATCTVTDTWVADAETASPTTAPASDAPSFGGRRTAGRSGRCRCTGIAGSGNATIEVNKAGIRTGPTTEAPLAGAAFAVYASEANAINGTNPLVQCVTGLNGQCSMDVFGTGTRDVWVREKSGRRAVAGTSGSTRSAREPRTRRATTRPAIRTWSGSTSGTTSSTPCRRPSP